MPDAYMTRAKARALEEIRQRNKQRGGVNYLEALLGIGVPPSHHELDRTVGRMKKVYDFPSGQPDTIPGFLQEKAANDARLQPIEPMGPSLDMLIKGREEQERKARMRALPPEEAMDTGFKTPQGRRVGSPDLGGATLPVDAALSVQAGKEPTLPSKPQGPSDEEKLRRLQGLRAIREGASQFRNITSASEVFMNKGVPPDRSVVDHDTREEESRVQSRIDEKREGDFNNPESPASQFARDLLKKSGIEVPDSMSATQAMALHPAVRDHVNAWAKRYETDRKRAADQADAAAEAGDMDAVSQGDLSKLPSGLKKDLLKERQSFYVNARVKDIKDRLDSSQRVMALVQTNPLAARAAMIDLARLSGEKGVLSNLDIQRWTQRPGLKGWFDKGVEFTTSDISEGMQNAIIEVAQTFETALQGAMEKEVNTRVEGIHDLYPQLPVDGLRKFFVGADSSEPEEKAEPGEASGEIAVKGSDGNTYWVKPQNDDGEPTGVGDTITTEDGQSISITEIMR